MIVFFCIIAAALAVPDFTSMFHDELVTYIDTVSTSTVGKYGVTPLHMLCLYEDTDNIVRLIEAGVDVNLQNDRGNTPFHDCVHRMSHNLVIAEAFLGASYEIDTANIGGETVFYMACYRQSVELARLLLEHGANPYIHGSKNVVDIAYQYGNQALIDLLKEWNVELPQ